MKLFILNNHLARLGTKTIIVFFGNINAIVLVTLKNQTKESICEGSHKKEIILFSGYQNFYATFQFFKNDYFLSNSIFIM